MQNGNHHDDSSHYEVSLTAGQAFVAFVLLLFSLAAAFGFGVIVGNGQFEDAATTAAAEPAPRTATAQQARIVELGEETASDRDDRSREKYSPPVIMEEPTAEPITTVATKPQPEIPLPAAPSRTSSAAAAHSQPAHPQFAQLLSTTDEKAAEALARKVIDGGFSSAYVERSATPRGTVHRVRVRFASEGEARRAIPQLRRFAAGEIWIAPVR